MSENETLEREVIFMDTESRPRETAYHVFLILLVLGALIVGGHYILQTIGHQTVPTTDDILADEAQQNE